jgi:hypothetical protein
MAEPEIQESDLVEWGTADGAFEVLATEGHYARIISTASADRRTVPIRELRMLEQRGKRPPKAKVEVQNAPKRKASRGTTGRG